MKNMYLSLSIIGLILTLCTLEGCAHAPATSDSSQSKAPASETAPTVAPTPHEAAHGSAADLKSEVSTKKGKHSKKHKSDVRDHNERRFEDKSLKKPH